jgi:hypothetical protein
MAHQSKKVEILGGLKMKIIKSFIAGVTALGITATAVTAADWQPKKAS